MTPTQLALATGCNSGTLAASWLPYILRTLDVYEINTVLRQAAFLAQIGHESGGLRHTSEMWGPTDTQSRYEGRADLGNTQPGDGYRFRGRGLIQITGRDNYARARRRMRERFPTEAVPDFEADPSQLAQAKWAALSAGDFWQRNNLNKWADIPDFDGVSDVINRGRKTARDGDANGYADRLSRYHSAIKALTNPRG